MRALAFAFLLAACTGETAPDVQTRAPVAAIAPPALPAFFDCLRSQNATLVGAHRGGPAPGYPENAMATFARTLARTPALLEIDVAQTRDGILVLMHDDTVERTTNGAGRVDSLSLEQFRALRLDDSRDRESPPTLADALDWAEGRTILELDIKEGVPFAAVVEAVQRAAATERVIVIVYSTAAAIRLSRLEPDLMLSVPIDEERDLDRLRRAGVVLDRVLAWTGTRAPDRALYQRLRARGVEIIIGARSDVGYGALVRDGVSLIASDDPEAAYRGIDAADGDGWAGERCLRQ